MDRELFRNVYLAAWDQGQKRSSRAADTFINIAKIQLTVSQPSQHPKCSEKFAFLDHAQTIPFI